MCPRAYNLGIKKKMHQHKQTSAWPPVFSPFLQKTCENNNCTLTKKSSKSGRTSIFMKYHILCKKHSKTTHPGSRRWEERRQAAVGIDEKRLAVTLPTKLRQFPVIFGNFRRLAGSGTLTWTSSARSWQSWKPACVVPVQRGRSHHPMNTYPQGNNPSLCPPLPPFAPDWCWSNYRAASSTLPWSRHNSIFVKVTKPIQCRQVRL